jgi:four helix bundle protein
VGVEVRAQGFKNFDEWVVQVPASIKNDSLWEFITYRYALFLADLAWFDADKIIQDARGKGIAWQLVDSAGSVAANIEEGYGRGFGKDYSRFLRISIGSARETRGWYYRSRHVLDAQVIEHRLGLIDEIIASLVIVAKQQRQK